MHSIAYPQNLSSPGAKIGFGKKEVPRGIEIKKPLRRFIGGLSNGDITFYLSYLSQYHDGFDIFHHLYVKPCGFSKFQ